MSDFLLHLLPVTARASHFLLRLGWVILQLAVPRVTVKADWPVGFPRLATEKGSHWAVAAVSFVARFSLRIGRFAFCPFALCR